MGAPLPFLHRCRLAEERSIQMRRHIVFLVLALLLLVLAGCGKKKQEDFNLSRWRPTITWSSRWMKNNM